MTIAKLTWLFLLCFLSGCQVATNTTNTAAADEPLTLTVFAASSLSDAFTELGQVFEAQHPGVTVQFNFASSSDLATQLAEGAAGDVFASANQKQMANAFAAARLTGEPINFLTNSLVIIVPTDNPAAIESLADLAREGLKLITALPDVPIRSFTEEMLDKASADPAYGDEFKSAVLANIVSEEANVRQLAAKVALGEADAGVVYTSDVTPDIAEQVLVIEIPPAFNVVAIYPIALVNDAANPEMAQAFVDLVLSTEGQDVLARWGFGPRPE